LDSRRKTQGVQQKGRLARHDALEISSNRSREDGSSLARNTESIESLLESCGLRPQLHTKLLVLAALILATAHGVAQAQVPKLIRYQGTLTDASNVPLEGTYTLRFRLYDAVTAGALLWDETQTGIAVSRGVFNVLLGNVTALNLAFDKDYWLSTEVSAGGELAPRQRLTSVPYAYRAETVNGLGDGLPNNLLRNGSFESWPLGASAAPATWTVASGTVGQCTTVCLRGQSSLNLTGPSAEVRCPFGVGTWEHLKGKAIVYCAWVKVTQANAARLAVGYGATTTYSSYHTGGGAWELLKVEMVVPSGATAFEPKLRVETATTAQFDAVCLMEGPIGFAFTQHPNDMLPQLTQYKDGSTSYGFGNVRIESGQVSVPWQQYGSVLDGNIYVTFQKTFSKVLGVVVNPKEYAGWIGVPELVSTTGFRASVTFNGLVGPTSGTQAVSWMVIGVD